MEFGRLFTAMVTPFDEQLNVNWAAVESLVDYLIEEQATEGLVVCGTTGESPTLSEDEKLEMMRVVVNKANGRCPVIAGTGSYNTADSIHMTLAAEKLGVDGVLLVAPYYNRPSQEGLYAHFRAIADATSLPVMLYNIPKRTGVTIAAETIIRLAADAENIVATKEAHHDLDLITSIISSAPNGFKVYSGDDNLTLPMLSLGAYGVVSVSSHIIGTEMNAMIEAFLQGNVAEAAKLHGQLHGIFNGLFRLPNPVLTKMALRLRGLQVGGVRLPLVDGTRDDEQFVQELLRAVK